MTWKTFALWNIGFGLWALALLSAAAIILSSVGIPVLGGFTYALADTESEVWALLFTCIALGFVVMSLGWARRDATPAASPAEPTDRLSEIVGGAEVVLLVIGLLCALLIFLCGVRMFGFSVRSTHDLWWMFLVCTGLAVFSTAKGRAIREWFSEEKRAERERERRAYES